MKALIKLRKGPDSVALGEMPEPAPKPGEIKVKVHACGICGTDLHILKDEFETDPPVAMGHEYAGTVVEVGAGVTGFKPGDKAVSMTTVQSCGVCQYCHEGLFHLCESRKALGCLINGGFAEYVVVPAARAFKVAEQVTLEEAALSEPLACVVRSIIEKGLVKAGDFVYVSGPGAIGLLAMQVANASGGICVIGGTRVDASRLEMARGLGAVETLMADGDDFAERCRQITEGRGFDVAIECAGAARSADTCLRVLKKTGRYIQIGLYGQSIPFDHDLALKKEITITNGFTSTKTSWQRALRLIQYGRVNVKPLISAILPLDDWEKGFAMAANKEGCKILLKP